MKASRYLTLVAGLALSGSVWAQTVDVPSLSGAPGDTLQGTVEFTAGAQNIASWQIDVSYDLGALGPVAWPECPATTAPVASPGTINCSLIAPGQPNNVFRVGMFTVPSDTIGSGNVAVFEFDIPAGTAPGTYPMTLVSSAFFAPDGSNVTGTATINVGTVTLSAPPGEGFYTSDPAPGDTLSFGTAEVGSSAGVETVNVENLSPDTAFDITGVTVAAPISNSDTFPITVDDGENEDVTFECTPDERGLLTGTVAIEHDSAGGAGSPVSYDYECTGLAPLVSVTPASETVNVLAIPGGTSDSATYSVFNDNADGFSSTATGFALATPLASGPGGTAPNISVIGIPDVAPGGTETFSVTCDADENTDEGTWTYNVEVSWNNPDPAGDDEQTVIFICEVVAAVPEYDSTPAPGDTLPFGSVTNGLTSAPQGIDVQNVGVGPSPDSDLNITGVSTTDNSGGSVFNATINNAGPFLVGAAGTVDAITVTCTPDTVGAITGTLTVNTNDPTEPAGGFEYDLTCEGLSDGEFSSDPDNGGTLNLGTVFPGDTTAPGSITFENDGTFDDIEVFGCSVSDPDGVMSFTPNPIPDPITVGPGGAESITFQCTPPLPGGYQATLSCSGVDGDQNFTGPLSYTILCQGQPLVVPTMNWWGLIALAALLLMLGGFASRRSGRNRA